MNRDIYPSPARLANRRKLWVFAVTFVLLSLAGLIYSYSRPTIYLASARVQINPGAMQVETAVASGGSQGTNTPRSLLNELQVLTSRPLVKEAFAKMPVAGRAAVQPLSDDPVAALQAGLEATVAEGTDVVEISSRGPDAQQSAALVNALVAAYTRQLSDSHTQTTGTALVQARDEVTRLTQKVLAQRRQVEDFRLRHSIVSFEREENEVLGRVKGQTEAMTKANEKLAQAEGKLRAMTESAAAGRPIVSSSRPNATLENMEQRASEAREELAELNRGFTAEYMAMDPRARALRTRLGELERQIVAQRQSSTQTAQTDQSAALADAREELTAARATVARTAQQASGNRVQLQRFASRFDEFRSLREALAPQEALLRDATQRLVRQETGEAARRPSVRVLEPAVAPTAPWQPQYTRDAAMVLGGALLLALLLMWLVELFNRVDAPPPIVVMQAPGYPPNIAPLYPSGFQSPYLLPYSQPYPLPYGAHPASLPYADPTQSAGLAHGLRGGTVQRAPSGTEPATGYAAAPAAPPTHQPAHQPTHHPAHQAPDQTAVTGSGNGAASNSADRVNQRAAHTATHTATHSATAGPDPSGAVQREFVSSAAARMPSVSSLMAQPSPPSPPSSSPSSSPSSPAPVAVSPISRSAPLAVPPLPLPRELLPDELAAVLSNSSPTVALFAHLLLRGLNAHEATTLCGSDVNTALKTIRIGGAEPQAAARELPLDGSLNDLIFSTFKLTIAGTGQPLLSAGNGGQIALDNLTSELLYAAHDAGVDRPDEVTPDLLRHTYAAFLARQGLRLADLARVIGPLSVAQVARYSAMAPPGKRLPLEQAQRLMPVLLAQPLTT